MVLLGYLTIFLLVFRYFSLQATKSLGIDDIVRFEIENNICQESGPTINCFKTPQKYTYYLIEEVYHCKPTNL